MSERIVILIDKTLNMKNMILSVALMSAALTGCSVKEDRMQCPCRLMLDFSEVDTSVVTSAALVMTGTDGFEFADDLSDDDFRHDYIVNIPKTSINVGIWSGAETMAYGGVKIPYGEDCPPVYFHTSVLNAGGESVREIVRMRRNHCVMTVKLDWNNADIQNVVLYGNVDGYEADGSPSPGDFMYSLDPDREGECSALLPRQTDASLALEVDDGTGVLKRFALGQYIEDSGYDWSEPDLKDIVVEIDIAVLKISLTIQGWDKEHTFDVVI